MNVLTLSRQAGSQGDQIARTVARTLGYAFMNHQIINRAARQAGVPEVALAHIDELGLFGLRPSPQEHRAYLSQVENVLREVAHTGRVVIVGCGAQVVLADHPQAVHMQVIAPFEIRLVNLMKEENIGEEAAMKRIAASDKKRASYLRANYDVNWLNPELYDLVLNTKRVSPAATVSCIVQFIQSHSIP